MGKRKKRKRFPRLTFILLIAIGIFTLNILKNNIYKPKAEWYLLLVNKENKLPNKFSVPLLELSNGKLIDERIYPDLQEMFDDMRSIGIFPKIYSAYRNKETQQELLNKEINDYKDLGHSKKEATSLAEKWVAPPSYSEHETGLALDINSEDGNTDEEVYSWLANNSYKYGFIIRYPQDKTYITGINYEPWHIRYVGKIAAEEIYNNQFCLEEYLK
jgi:zinc D-Ala-D-Ala carboxypeptidase